MTSYGTTSFILRYQLTINLRRCLKRSFFSNLRRLLGSSSLTEGLGFHPCMTHWQHSVHSALAHWPVLVGPHWHCLSAAGAPSWSVPEAADLPALVQCYQSDPCTEQHYSDRLPWPCGLPPLASSCLLRPCVRRTLTAPPQDLKVRLISAGLGDCQWHLKALGCYRPFAERSCLRSALRKLPLGH